MFLLESFTPRLSVLTSTGLDTVAELPGVVPDGVALTAGGSSWSAVITRFGSCWSAAPGTTYRLLIDDEKGIHIPMPTNVAFFGDELRSLAIACLGGSTICALDAIGLEGAPLHRPVTDR